MNRIRTAAVAFLFLPIFCVTARADIEGLGTARILADLLERIPAPR